ncbi:MAG: histidine phosphatase family protein [Actinomycetota bacterium]|nr:histidine phosphatase family protein [Actinomycetota bacterium]
MTAESADAEPETTTTRLVLVRHGESQAQVDRVVGGPTGCTGLSDLGRRQVAALAQRWHGSGLVVDRLLASTLPRAVETAELLAPALGGLVVSQDPELVELEPGECDGLSWDDYQARYHVDMRADPYAELSPGGESVAGFLLRIGRALHRIAVDHPGQTVVVACHGGVIDGSLACFLGVAVQRAADLDLRTTNSAVTEWLVEAEKGRPLHWALRRYNDAAHLEALAAGEGPLDPPSIA